MNIFKKLFGKFNKKPNDVAVDNTITKPIVEPKPTRETPIKIRAVPCHKWTKSLEYSFADCDNWRKVYLNWVIGFDHITIDFYMNDDKFIKLKKQLKTYGDLMDYKWRIDEENRRFKEKRASQDERYSKINY